MALVHSYTMIAKPEAEEALAAALDALSAAVTQIAGSQGATVLRDRKDPLTFLFLEFWDSEEARKTAGPLLPKEVMSGIMAALGKPPQMAEYDRLG